MYVYIIQKSTRQFIIQKVTNYLYFVIDNIYIYMLFIVVGSS